MQTTRRRFFGLGILGAVVAAVSSPGGWTPPTEDWVKVKEEWHPAPDGTQATNISITAANGDTGRLVTTRGETYPIAMVSGDTLVLHGDVQYADGSIKREKIFEATVDHGIVNSTSEGEWPGLRANVHHESVGILWKGDGLYSLVNGTDDRVLCSIQVPKIPPLMVSETRPWSAYTYREVSPMDYYYRSPDLIAESRVHALPAPNKISQRVIDALPGFALDLIGQGLEAQGYPNPRAPASRVKPARLSFSYWEKRALAKVRGDVS